MRSKDARVLSSGIDDVTARMLDVTVMPRMAIPTRAWGAGVGRSTTKLSTVFVRAEGTSTAFGPL